MFCSNFPSSHFKVSQLHQNLLVETLLTKCLLWELKPPFISLLVFSDHFMKLALELTCFVIVDGSSWNEGIQRMILSSAADDSHWTLREADGQARKTRDEGHTLKPRINHSPGYVTYKTKNKLFCWSILNRTCLVHRPLILNCILFFLIFSGLFL